MTRKKLKLYIILDTMLLVLGVAIFGASIYGLYNNFAFEVLLFSGTLGTIMTMLGASLLMDMIKLRTSLKASSSPYLYHIG